MDTQQITFLVRVILYGYIGLFFLWASYRTRREKFISASLFVAGAPLVFLAVIYAMVLFGAVGPNAFMAYTGWVGLTAFTGGYFSILFLYRHIMSAASKINQLEKIIEELRSEE